MLFAGVDEAGFGPLLGPLVIGGCVLRVDGEPGEVPELWSQLKRIVSDKRDRTGRRLHVADSKKVYAASVKSVGLKELEKTVLAFLSVAGVEATCLDDVLRLASSAKPSAPWHAAPDSEIHPADIDVAAVAIAANALRHECDGCGVEVVRLAGQVLFEAEYNRMCAATRNKSAVLQSVTAWVLAEVLEAARRDGEDALIVCDRHGGRAHYGRYLQQMFPDWQLSVGREEPEFADYTLTRGERSARVIFAEKGETLAMPTALASMMAKYLRERLMSRFNAWWVQQVPGISPTAGYWTDGMRFLEEIASVRSRLGIEDGMLIRER